MNDIELANAIRRASACQSSSTAIDMLKECLADHLKDTVCIEAYRVLVECMDHISGEIAFRYDA